MSATVPVWLFRFVLPDGSTTDKALEIQSVRIGPKKQQRWAKVPADLESFVSASVVQRATQGEGKRAKFYDDLQPVERWNRCIAPGEYQVYVRPADVMR